jgi:transcriptional regulator with XRE-family HTH domain
MGRRQTLSDQLRAAIRDSGLSVYRIAKETGVSQPSISRFLNRKRTINIEAAEALATFFNMWLTEPRLSEQEKRPTTRKRSDKS